MIASIERDAIAAERLARGRLRVDMRTGEVFGRLRRPLGTLTKNGYLRTQTKGGSMMVHRIVCIAAHGLPVGERTLVNHKNGIKTDNRPENLEWATIAENAQHAKENGLARAPIGAEHYATSLSDADVLSIRRRHADGETYLALAEAFGICRWSISAIVRAKTWKHIERAS